MNLVNCETSGSSITTIEWSIFNLALVHFYSRIVLKRTSADQMVIYRKVEKNATLYAKKKLILNNRKQIDKQGTFWIFHIRFDEKKIFRNYSLLAYPTVYSFHDHHPGIRETKVV